MSLGCSHLCRQTPRRVDDIGVAVCEVCSEIEWYREGVIVDPAEAMAALFGSYELLGPLPALAAPAPTVLAYMPPSARKARSLGVIPLRSWLRASASLWLATDGTILLLATDHALLYENLIRGA